MNTKHVKVHLRQISTLTCILSRQSSLPRVGTILPGLPPSRHETSAATSWEGRLLCLVLSHSEQTCE